jgi:3-hydroxyacyl-[acyl-carrier protein] dehydratase/trans-2-decenoyl-[acyl-carrier protein] isomerase
MRYAEFRERDRFSQEELLALGHGTLLEDAPPEFVTRLPVPPMLMLDRVTRLSRSGNKGRIVAERDVRLDDWFFQCHFRGDPVQPGCLGVDGVWQALGLFCAWSGGLGAGRALGVGEIEFAGQIRPYNRVVTTEIDVVRFVTLKAAGSCLVIGDAVVSVDGEPIYTLKRAKVGIFRGLDYPDYPARSKNAVGGRLATE